MDEEGQRGEGGPRGEGEGVSGKGEEEGHREKIN